MRQQTVILFLLLITNIGLAQSINIGFKIEPSVILTDGLGGKATDETIYSGHFLLGYKFNEKIQIEFQPGFVFFLDKYNSSNIGLVGKYYLWGNDSYLLAGLWMNHQRNSNTHLYRGYDFTTVLGSMGYGIFLGKIVFCQLSYQFPIGNNDIGYTIMQNAFDPRLNTFVKEEMIGILKFGLGLSFDL